MKNVRPSLLCLALIAASSAHAQLKPPPSSLSTPALPTAPAASPAPAAAQGPVAASESESDKEAAAQLSAGGWLVLLDRRDWGRAWESTSSVFRATVPLSAWMDGIPKARDPWGAFVDRAPAEANYRNELPGYPNGDYVTVIFNSKFAGKEDAKEIITMMRERDGRWRPTGYSTR